MGGRRTLVMMAGALVASAISMVGTGAEARLANDERDVLRGFADVYGGSASWQWGDAFATGYFNNDLHLDLAIGSTIHNVNGSPGAGSVTVVYGGVDGFDWGSARLLHQDVTGVGTATANGEFFGHSLAAGDFDDDGFDDLAVGAPFEGSGAVYVFSGDVFGFDLTDVRRFQQGQVLVGDSVVTNMGTPPGAAEAFDQFGYALEAGDFDGDGTDDLAIGVPGEDINAGGNVPDAGTTVVFYGSAAPASPSGLTALTNVVLLESTPNASAAVGTTLATIPADGGDRLAIGLPGLNRLEVVDGVAKPTANELRDLAGTVYDTSTIPGASTGTFSLARDALAVGDFDGDGEADLAVSDRGDLTTPDPSVWVIDGPLTDGTIEATEHRLLADGVMAPPSADWKHVVSVAAGDFDGDGKDDLVVNAETDNGTAEFEHAALAWYSGPAGVDPTSSDLLPGGYGDAHAADLDNDGNADVVIGEVFDTVSFFRKVLIRFGDWSAGTLTWTTGNPFEYEGSTTVTLTRSGGGDGAVSVDVETIASGGATAGVDFTPVSTTFEWADGEMGDRTFDIAIARDGEVDRFENIILRVTRADGIAAPDDRVLSILDGDLVPVDPARVLESRSGQETIDGISAGTGRLDAGEIVEVPIAGRAGVPEGVVAVAVNTTVIGPSAPGFITLFACTPDVPNASALNYSTGSIVGNGGVVKLSDDGSLCAFSRSATDLAIDVTGFIPEGSKIEFGDPIRVLDTRAGQETIDGVAAGEGAIDAGTSREVQIAGRPGVPADAVSVFLNITAPFPAGNGFITTHDCDEEAPNASNLNYRAGAVTGNGTVAELSDDGTLCFFSRSTADVVVDVTGYEDASVVFRTFATRPSIRLFDSRAGQDTFDGEFAGAGRLSARQPVTIEVAERVGSAPFAAFVNVTVVNPAANGHVRLYPCTDEVPLSSALNFRAGETRGNNAYVQLSADGALCVYSIVETDLIIDYLGESRRS